MKIFNPYKAVSSQGNCPQVKSAFLIQCCIALKIIIRWHFPEFPLTATRTYFVFGSYPHVLASYWATLRFRNNLTTIRFQLWNSLCQDFPSDFRGNSTVTVCRNISHPANLSAGCTRTLHAEFIHRLPCQFTDLTISLVLSLIPVS